MVWGRLRHLGSRIPVAHLFQSILAVPFPLHTCMFVQKCVTLLNLHVNYCGIPGKTSELFITANDWLSHKIWCNGNFLYSETCIKRTPSANAVVSA